MLSDARSLARTRGGAFAATTTAGAPSTLIVADAIPLQYVFVSRAIQDHGLYIIRNARAVVARSSNDAFAQVPRADDFARAATEVKSQADDRDRGSPRSRMFRGSGGEMQSSEGDSSDCNMQDKSSASHQLQVFALIGFSRLRRKPWGGASSKKLCFINHRRAIVCFKGAGA